MTPPERLLELASAAEPRAGVTTFFFLDEDDYDVTQLLLIRHAQVEAGDMAQDHHLTELGLEQAEVLAAYLTSHSRMHALYASPTLRAQQTAAPIARAQSLDIHTVDALRDVETRRRFDRPLTEMIAAEFGVDQVDAVLGRIQTEMTWDALAPFIESAESFRERTDTVLDEIAARHHGQRVAVVTHGPVIMSYVARVVGSPRDFVANPRLTSLTKILCKDDRRTLQYLNATPHFQMI
jgi:probable phosphoglycerate mutase